MQTPVSLGTSCSSWHLFKIFFIYSDFLIPWTKKTPAISDLYHPTVLEQFNTLLIIPTVAPFLVSMGFAYPYHAPHSTEFQKSYQYFARRNNKLNTSCTQIWMHTRTKRSKKRKLSDIYTDIGKIFHTTYQNLLENLLLLLLFVATVA